MYNGAPLQYEDNRGIQVDKRLNGGQFFSADTAALLYGASPFAHILGRTRSSCFVSCGHMADYDSVSQHSWEAACLAAWYFCHPRLTYTGCMDSGWNVNNLPAKAVAAVSDGAPLVALNPDLKSAKQLMMDNAREGSIVMDSKLAMIRAAPPRAILCTDAMSMVNVGFNTIATMAISATKVEGKIVQDTPTSSISEIEAGIQTATPS